MKVTLEFKTEELFNEFIKETIISQIDYQTKYPSESNHILEYDFNTHTGLIKNNNKEEL